MIVCGHGLSQLFEVWVCNHIKDFQDIKLCSTFLVGYEASKNESFVLRSSEVSKG